MAEELKRVEIKNGKFTLEGKIVNANPIKLTFIEFDPEDLKEDLEDEGDGSYPGIRKATLEREEKELREFYQNKPENTNAYVLGEPKKEYHSGGGGFAGGDHYTYPILYLKII